ncbi:MAG: hypothetical protein J0I34_08985 [Pseudonocardia sp.]|uniref:hypothetical protein n=1 Tax=unclassified Pseudonocardia TaxID=2619320 RepID=UPI0008699E9E|nr:MULTISPECIES: hypothetical protein [unclassified Pseudonocardia]MBN9108903.1 hypothetical protein [Pseudonocardia sp.]ODU23439.1 MAG: hypothetical protein ABS80_14880 [Pseudonocardia sp. SCN 72-51]ODV03607.1 MAG: hypothetical protein ABT15_22520 [Pseudonocardia sp. SCN 73-27]
MHIGIAHHFGWAVAVTASAAHEVVDRRRIELVEPGIPVAPVHHDGADLDDTALADMLVTVGASAARATAAELDALAADLPGPVVSLSLRAWPSGFPTDLAVVRRAPYEGRADSVMYLRVLDDVARARSWAVHLFDAKDVEARASGLLGDRAREVLHGPRARLGPPWTKDHRIALAATVLAAG